MRDGAMSSGWLVSVLVGYVAGVAMAAWFLPEMVDRLWLRAMAVTGGFLALALAAVLWHRGRRGAVDDGAAGWRVRWERLVWAMDRLLDRLLPPSGPAPMADPPAQAAPAAKGLRRPGPAGGAVSLGAGILPVVRLPQRFACMAWMPAGEERSTGRELGRLARAVGLARDLGFANRATALLVELDPLVLATAAARSRLSTFVGNPSPPGCTLVPIFRLEPGAVPEDLPLDLVLDLVAPERLEFGLLVDGLTGFEVERLRRLGFVWLVVPSTPFLAQGADDGLDPALVDRLEACRGAGIRVIVRDLASERELLEVLDYPVDFATGPLFRPAVEEGWPAKPAPRRVA